jgi:hypothetical protein
MQTGERVKGIIIELMMVEGSDHQKLFNRTDFWCEKRFGVNPFWVDYRKWVGEINREVLYKLLDAVESVNRRRTIW